ncbi:16S rRNA (cytidine(1402)-2'-O)-methyltransferase [Alkalicoccus luteus]|uniref:Ribosomal RNA small subunit methyltransferase I n=1 Tax=Alkalicoccus luteus TaxID=1237094 RepID=A0A969TW30_9BACI|nr:16S rRNA (cytidine(1402)-2'-O)-methyltransferase [Alkalicoccus luteus]NJP39010.1 16S rRNA (cytidine(1402)-2'-O)-methyltransferase [Alkalicoccus luteus]
MHEQRTYQADGGMLVLVPTPIGNLEDMTFRAVRELKEADVIAAEDTRHTRKLCHVYEIETPLISFHEHSSGTRLEELLEKVRSGKKVALVSDAGTPGVSDPGWAAVDACRQEGLTVTALPGASAAVTALTASGLPTTSFTFLGFSERKKKKRTDLLEEWRTARSTLIFYESPHRLDQMLQAAFDVYGPRRAAIGRELTKQFETYVTGTLKELAAWAADTEIKGECVILIEGADEEEAAAAGKEWWQELSLKQHVEHHIEKGHSSKQAIKQTAVDRSMPKRDVYAAYHDTGAI